MTRITRIQWSIPSGRTSGLTYTVSAPALDAALTCDCAANHYPRSRGRCRHIILAATGQAGPPRIGCVVEPDGTKPVSRSAGQPVSAETFVFQTPQETCS